MPGVRISESGSERLRVKRIHQDLANAEKRLRHKYLTVGIAWALLRGSCGLGNQSRVPAAGCAPLIYIPPPLTTSSDCVVSNLANAILWAHRRLPNEPR
jgi:hypothetical protein